MDEEVCKLVSDSADGILVTNSKYLSHDIQAIMRRCEVFVGMRFHSLILASAVKSPIIGLIYAPKVRGYMRHLNTPELSLELNKVNYDTLCKTLLYAWNNRENIRSTQQEKIDALRDGAHRAADILKDKYFSNY